MSALAVLPYLLFGLIAGALADRFSRRRMMVLSDSVSAVALLSVPVAYLFGVGTVAQVLLVTFVSWTAFVWFDAAAWGALTSVVGRDQLVRANSVVWSFGVVAAIVMPALAGVVGVAHPSIVLAFDGLTYVVSALLIVRIRTTLNPTKTAARDPKPTLRQTIPKDSHTSCRRARSSWLRWRPWG